MSDVKHNTTLYVTAHAYWRNGECLLILLQPFTQRKSLEAVNNIPSKAGCIISQAPQVCPRSVSCTADEGADSNEHSGPRLPE